MEHGRLILQWSCSSMKPRVTLTTPLVSTPSAQLSNNPPHRLQKECRACLLAHSTRFGFFGSTKGRVSEERCSIVDELIEG